jgi:hypothetical protein
VGTFGTNAFDLKGGFDAGKETCECACGGVENALC